MEGTIFFDDIRIVYDAGYGFREKMLTAYFQGKSDTLAKLKEGLTAREYDKVMKILGKDSK